MLLHKQRESYSNGLCKGLNVKLVWLKGLGLNETICLGVCKHN